MSTRMLSVEFSPPASPPPPSPDYHQCRFSRQYSLPSGYGRRQAAGSSGHVHLDRFRPYHFTTRRSCGPRHASSEPRSITPSLLCRAQSDSFDGDRHHWHRDTSDNCWPPPRGAFDEDQFLPGWHCTADHDAEFIRTAEMQAPPIHRGSPIASSADWKADEKKSVVYKQLQESLLCMGGPENNISSLGPCKIAKNPNRESDNIAKSLSLGQGHGKNASEQSISIISDGRCNGSVERDAPMAVNDDVKGRPLSLRMLKRKHSTRSRAAPADPLNQVSLHQIALKASASRAISKQQGVGPDSFNSAFSWLVFMIKTLQQHTLSLRKVLMRENLQGVMSMVHAETQDSFLWLFQQVFSCTPKLMLLIMMLLADFTVHSMGKHVALAVLPMGEPPTAVVSSKMSDTDERFSLTLDGSSGSSIRIRLQDADLASSAALAKHGTSFVPAVAEGGDGSGVVKNSKVEGGPDDHIPHGPLIANTRTRAIDAHEEGWSRGSDLSASCRTECNGASAESSGVKKEEVLLRLVWESLSRKESDTNRNSETVKYLDLDPKIKRALVAPVVAEMEVDDYACYDRTDLNYQHEISMDPSNPLLLANYAQFLYLVRHDHSRAEELFRRAIRADPVDGEVMGRFASFLWIARGDVAAADEAYRAAVAADPSNSFYAGCYAHFLWNSSALQEEEDGAACLVNMAAPS